MINYQGYVAFCHLIREKRRTGSTILGNAYKEQVSNLSGGINVYI